MKQLKFIYLNKILEIIDIMINSVFISEFVIKAISQGFILDDNSYLRDSWNVLDFSIVVFSIIDMSLPGSDISFLKAYFIYFRL